MKRTFNLTLHVQLEIEETTPTVPIDSNPPTDPVDPQPPVTSGKKFYGINTMPYRDVELIKFFGSARVLCAGHWIWPDKDGIYVQPLYQGEKPAGNGLDKLLTALNTAGVEPALCIHGTPEWLFPTVKPGEGDGGNEYPPIRPGTDRTKPESYAEYANMLRNMAARYGYSTGQSNLSVSKQVRYPGSEQVIKTGMKVLKYLEPWNENRKWWKRKTDATGKDLPTEYFTVQETAAFMLACYMGIKAGDDKMKVIFPGSVDCDPQWFKDLDAEFKKINGGKWPCDVIAIHWYNNKNKGQRKYPPDWEKNGSCMPWDDPTVQDFYWVRDFVKNTLKMELWLNEYGCDTILDSPMANPGKEAWQAEYAVKATKWFKEQGVNRCFFYHIADEPGVKGKGGLYQSSGIYTGEDVGMQPKPVLAAMKAMIEADKA